MRVQSVPTVFGFLNGQPVDGFAGAQPESAVTQFVEKLSEAAPGQADISGLLQSGTNALGENEPEKAMQAFQQALSLSPESPEAIAGFIRCLIALGEHEEAKAVLDQLDEDMQKKPIIKDVLAALAVAKKGAEVDSDKSDLEKKLCSVIKECVFPDLKLKHAIKMVSTSLKAFSNASEKKSENDEIRSDSSPGTGKTSSSPSLQQFQPPHPSCPKKTRSRNVIRNLIRNLIPRTPTTPTTPQIRRDFQGNRVLIAVARPRQKPRSLAVRM